MSRERSADAFGSALRTWRATRRMSQLDLASLAGVSTRHLSFIETGRARPSREMVVHLAEQLDVPNRERNTLLVAAGFAPLYSETPLAAPEMGAARAVIDQLLETHPYPAIAVDRRWDLVNANPAAFALIEGVDQDLLGPPLNVYRLTLHPEGLQSRIENFDEYAAHMIARLQQLVSLSADPELVALLEEVGLRRSSSGQRASANRTGAAADAAPSRRSHPLADVHHLGVRRAPVDVTLAELTLEMFFPADAATTALLADHASPS